LHLFAVVSSTSGLTSPAPAPAQALPPYTVPLHRARAHTRARALSLSLSLACSLSLSLSRALSRTYADTLTRLLHGVQRFVAVHAPGTSGGWRRGRADWRHVARKRPARCFWRRQQVCPCWCPPCIPTRARTRGTRVCVCACVCARALCGAANPTQPTLTLVCRALAVLVVCMIHRRPGRWGSHQWRGTVHRGTKAPPTNLHAHAPRHTFEHKQRATLRVRQHTVAHSVLVCYTCYTCPPSPSGLHDMSSCLVASAPSNIETRLVA